MYCKISEEYLNNDANILGYSPYIDWKYNCL